MSAIELERFETAFDHVERQIQLERDWGPLEAGIRRRLRRPFVRLAWTVLFVAGCVALGLSGMPQGWLVAAGVCLAVLPERVADVRRRREALAAVASTADVRALVRDETKRRMAGSFVRGLVTGVLGVVYIFVGVVAWLLGKTPMPGLIAGAIVLVYSAVLLLVLFPRAARESSLLSHQGTDDVDA